MCGWKCIMFLCIYYCVWANVCVQACSCCGSYVEISFLLPLWVPGTELRLSSLWGECFYLQSSLLGSEYGSVSNTYLSLWCWGQTRPFSVLDYTPRLSILWGLVLSEVSGNHEMYAPQKKGWLPYLLCGLRYVAQLLWTLTSLSVRWDEQGNEIRCDMPGVTPFFFCLRPDENLLSIPHPARPLSPAPLHWRKHHSGNQM